MEQETGGVATFRRGHSQKKKAERKIQTHDPVFMPRDSSRKAKKEKKDNESILKAKV